MAVNYMVVIGAITTGMLIAAVARQAAANPLCALPDVRQRVESMLAESPQSSPAQIARSTGIAEAAVIHSLPIDTRVSVSMGGFDGLWQKFTDWDDALVIVLSSQSVFELFGPLPAGNVEHGHFNFDASDRPYGGHLKVDRLVAIYLMSTVSRNGETHQVAFFDHEGRRVFSVYVRRDAENVLQTQPHNRFLRMKQDYDAISQRSLLTGLSCPWPTAVEQESGTTEEGSE